VKRSAEDAKLYFDLMLALQHYVNQELKILPKVKNSKEYSKKFGTEEKVQVRNALYENPAMIESFIKNNPEKFDTDKLDIISNWQNFIQGEFFIERFLKNYAIFIKDDDVYAVSALYDSFDDFIPPAILPIYVKAVLLPFKGKIIYDGVFVPYNMLFGNGYKSDLKEVYMDAKLNNRIIKTIDTTVITAQAKEKLISNA